MFGFRLVSLEWVYVFMGENQWRMAGEGQREKKVSEEVRGDGGQSLDTGGLLLH